MLSVKRLFAAMAAMLLAQSCLAATVVTGSANTLSINTNVDNFKFIEITGPNDFHLRTESLTLTSKAGFSNGQYRFEVTANMGASHKQVTTAHGRDGNTKTGDSLSVVDTGYFIIYNGTVVDVTAEKK